jgi:coenzyme F420-reducing hydrogenase beta subunit
MKIAPTDICTGCMACINVCPVNCISPYEDDEGFCQPIIDKTKCINCGKCTAACPVLNAPIKHTDDTPVVYAVWNKDPLLLSKSTSGGAFGALAKQVLNGKGIVYGVAYSEDLLVNHIRVTTEDELQKLHGSKYVQSKIGYIYRSIKEDLDKAINVLFSGTPCQVAGLYGFLGHDKYDNLYTCDLVCHGVPSPGVYEKYIKYMEEKNNSKMINIEMRTKKRGWNSTLDMKHSYENGTVIETFDAFNDPYMNGFLYDLILRKSCYECRYAKIPRESDITLADFWGIGSEMPFNHPTEQGISMIMINTSRGKDLFNICKNNVYFEERNLNEAKKGNVMLSPRVHSNPNREKFFNDQKIMPFDVLTKKYLSRKESIKNRFINIIIKTLGRDNIKRIKNVMKIG